MFRKESLLSRTKQPNVITDSRSDVLERVKTTNPAARKEHADFEVRKHNIG
jgi:hypothetical protein